MKFELLHEHLETAPEWADLFRRGPDDDFIDVHDTANHVSPTPKANLASEADAQKVKSSAAARLADPDAFLSRTDLRELGLERRAVDAVFRHCPVLSLPGYSRPLIRVADYLEFVEQHTYRGDRVRTCRST